MHLPSLTTLARYRVAIAVLAIVICAVTWGTELVGWVYVCPYCRAQRTVIGLLGLLLLTPLAFHWIGRWLGATVAAFGFSVGADQHFNGWKKIMAGKFSWGEQWYIHPWLLSGFAMFIISGLLLYLWSLPGSTNERLSSDQV